MRRNEDALPRSRVRLDVDFLASRDIGDVGEKPSIRREGRNVLERGRVQERFRSPIGSRIQMSLPVAGPFLVKARRPSGAYELGLRPSTMCFGSPVPSAALVRIGIPFRPP